MRVGPRRLVPVAARRVTALCLTLAMSTVACGGSSSSGTIDSAACRTNGAPSDAEHVTDPARFDLPSLCNDGRLRLSDFAGKPLVVNFFASWCLECEREAPVLLKMNDRLSDRVQFVAVNSQETGNGRAFANKLGFERWPLGRDVGERRGGLSRELGARGLPVTAFYDADGKLVETAFAAMTAATLQEFIERDFGITV